MVSLVWLNLGKFLEFYELVVVCKCLIWFGWEQFEIVIWIGLLGKYVEGFLFLIGVDKGVCEMVMKGEVVVLMVIEVLCKYGLKVFEKFQQGLCVVQVVGGECVMCKYMFEVVFKKQVSKVVFVLFNMMCEVKVDFGYQYIFQDLWEKFDVLLVELDLLEQQQ